VEGGDFATQPAEERRARAAQHELEGSLRYTEEGEKETWQRNLTALGGVAARKKGRGAA